MLVLVYTLRSFVEFFYVPPKNLSGEIVVLTGAAGGFGCLLAKKLAKKGEIYFLYIFFETDCCFYSRPLMC